MIHTGSLPMSTLSNRSLLMTTAIALCALSVPSLAAAQAQPQTQAPPQTQTQTQSPPAPQTQPQSQAQERAQEQDQGNDDDQQETEVGDVVVTATRSDVISAADRMIYNVANDLQTQTGSVADALRNVPGVEVDLQGNVSLRGDSNVTIMIDGRPSAMMNGQGRADVLQAMSANNIERVEVITNPSAAFSPEGSGGIINLVTRQTRQATSTATVRASWDGDQQGNVSISGSRSSNGLTLAGDLGWRRQYSEIELDSSRTRPNASPAATVIEDTTYNGPNTMEMANGRLSADYDLNARDRISGEISFRDMDGSTEGVSTFERANGLGAVSDRYQSVSDNGYTNSAASARGSWRRRFSGEGHELVADVRYDNSSFDRSQFSTRTTSVGSMPSYVERITNDSERDAYGLKIDYTRPMGEGRTLKLGYEGEFSRDEFDAFGERGATASSMTTIPALSNQFEYDQDIHAAYVTYERAFGELSIQGGLRVEQVDFTLNQITSGVTVDRDYFRAYPTVHLSYGLTETQRLRASYSRRIQRPSPGDLNPYVSYQDPQNLRQGNPNLDPEITDSFELSWQLRGGGGFYALTGFYRTSSGGVTDVARDLGGGVVLTTRENLGENDRYGVEFIASGRLSPQLSYNASGTFYQVDIFTPGVGLGGAGVSQSGATGMARASINWQPTTKDFFQLNGFWLGEQVQAQGHREALGMLNIGYRRKLTDDFSLVFTGTNILDTAEQKTVIDTPWLQDRTSVRFAEPTYYIGFTWSLGGGQSRRQEPAFDFGTPVGPG